MKPNHGSLVFFPKELALFSIPLLGQTLCAQPLPSSSRTMMMAMAFRPQESLQDVKQNSVAQTGTTTQERQRILHRVNLRMAARVYKEARKVEREALISAIDPDKAAQSCRQLYREIQALFEAHNLFCDSTTDLGPVVLVYHLRIIDRLRDVVNDRFQTLAAEILKPLPDFQKVAQQAMALEYVTEEWYRHYSAMGTELGFQNSYVMASSHFFLDNN